VSTDRIDAWYRRNFVDTEREESLARRGKIRARIPSALWAACQMCDVKVRVEVKRRPR
jgi:hypothetical protein